MARSISSNNFILQSVHEPEQKSIALVLRLAPNNKKEGGALTIVNCVVNFDEFIDKIGDSILHTSCPCVNGDHIVPPSAKDPNPMVRVATVKYGELFGDKDHYEVRALLLAQQIAKINVNLQYMATGAFGGFAPDPVTLSLEAADVLAALA